MTSPPTQVAILGAGPIGLDAALACADAGVPFTVYEAGDTVGAHVAMWGHVRLFTPWRMNLSRRMRTRLPEAPGDERCPSGHELLDTVLRPLAAHPALAGRIRPRHRIRAVGRAGLLKHEEISTPDRAAAPFRILIDTPEGQHVEHADAVLDCTGTYGQPNATGDGGIAAPGETALGARISRALPPLNNDRDRSRWRGSILLVGAGKSAQTAARDLAALPDTRLDWVVRNPDPDWGEIPDDTLPSRQALVDAARRLAGDGQRRVTVHAGCTVEALVPEGDRILASLRAPGGVRRLTVDHVLSLTGYVGDASLYRQLQIHECYATAAPMNLSATLLAAAGGDCLAQPAVGIDALRTPEPNFFVLGAKSYGRLSTFLLRVGYEQVDQITAGYPTPTPAAVTSSAKSPSEAR
ncbi:MAG: hypothetical protein M3Z25_03335 [Actinomycetota bacterium]|nr:hypothetical protein [Actinomycetota bacterium]